MERVSQTSWTTTDAAPVPSLAASPLARALGSSAWLRRLPGERCGDREIERRLAETGWDRWVFPDVYVHPIAG
jgi:hypothetical protein